jgi:hypothetical protein
MQFCVLAQSPLHCEHVEFHSCFFVSCAKSFQLADGRDLPLFSCGQNSRQHSLVLSTIVIMNIWCDNFELPGVTVILWGLVRSQRWENSF